MSSFAPASKSTTTSAASLVETYPVGKIKSFKVFNLNYFFQTSDIEKVPYKPDAAVDDVLCFRHYNEDEVIAGKPMHEWLRFSVCYWHTFRGTGI